MILMLYSFIFMQKFGQSQSRVLGLLMLKISYSMEKVLAESTGELCVPKMTVANLKLIIF